MTDERKPPDNNLSEEDIALWRSMTRDTERFEEREYAQPSKKNKEKQGVKESVRAYVPDQPSPKSAKGKDLDHRTRERLRKGQMPIEGMLDLHGLNREEAYEAVRRFVIGSHQMGKRCILIITGKGRGSSTSGDVFFSKPGILKQKLPEWLNEQGLDDIVLAHHAAKQGHGGDGAFYILLRRKRA